MPGGNKNINGNDGVRFEKGNKAAEKWTEEIAMRLGNELIEWLGREDENVFFEDFIYLEKHEGYPRDLYPDLLQNLTKRFSSFKDLIVKAKKIEEIKLKKFSAFNKLNPQICKFLLSAQYGYTEKIATDNTLKAEVKVGIINIDPLSDEGDNGTD